MRRGNIAAEMARRDITQKMMMKELGISWPTLSSYMSGNPIPSDKLEKMTAMFGCTAEYLLQQTESWPRETA